MEERYPNENVLQLAERVISTGKGITESEAAALQSAPLDILCEAASRITAACASHKFDTCSIINGKSGKCPEDCKWCAQSAHWHSDVSEYPLADTERLLDAALCSRRRGIGRFSIVTSGRKLTHAEVRQLCDSVRVLSEKAGISLCLSAGLLPDDDMKALAEAGISRYHCNLETAPSYFGRLCTTHTQAEKTATLKAASRAGMEICSGGIIGMGESMAQRIELALVLRNLGVRSVPVNILSPIHGTPLENEPLIPEEEILRTIAILRFILPDAALRFAGGRARLSPQTVLQAYRTGINAAIMGDMLTTAGADIDMDMARIREAGYEL